MKKKSLVYKPTQISAVHQINPFFFTAHFPFWTSTKMLKLAACLSALLAVLAAARPEENNVSEYGFKYAVKDPHTHDRKSHWEAQEAGKVRGAYRLVEPDGSLRTVEYTADGRNGFNAIVTREKHGRRQVTYHGKRRELAKPSESERRFVYH